MSRDMIQRLRCRDARGVTGRAIVWIDAEMVEANAGEAVEVIGDMTGGAVEARRHMIDGLAQGDVAIMAQRTVTAIDTKVVERGVRKLRRPVTDAAIRIGWQVIAQLTDCDHIVVAHFTIVNDTKVIKSTAGKGAECMTDAAVFACRQVIGRFAARGEPMAGGAIVNDAGMIKGKHSSKTLGVVAVATIRIGCRMIGRLANRVDAVVACMAVCAWLRHRIDHRVVKHTTEAEAHNAVADRTINLSRRMADRLTRRRGGVVTGIAALPYHIRTSVIRIGRQKARCRMTITAFRIGHDVAFVFACGHGAIVAAGAYPGDP